MPFEIKEEFKKTRVAFGNSGAALEGRKDLHLLAEAALHPDGSVKDQSIIDYFVTEPTLEEIKQAKKEGFKSVPPSKEAQVTNAQESTTGTTNLTTTDNTGGKKK
jgi:hypothetical protein